MWSAAKLGLGMMLLIAATSGARAQDKAKEFEGLVKQVVKQIEDSFISKGRAPTADDVKKLVEETLKGKGFTERKTALLLESVVTALGKAALAETDAANKELI